MRFLGRSLAVACTAACAFAIATSAAVAATEPVPSPSPSASAAPTGSPLREIGRVRAVTPFCRLIFDDAAALADDQLADIRTTTEVLRILAYAPLDRDVFTERRAVKALQTLSDRLMASRRGTAQVHVAGLRTAARGADGQAPRPDLARFAGALDGAHSESSRVAHEIAGVVSVLDVPELAVGGLYLPDYRFATIRASRAPRRPCRSRSTPSSSAFRPVTRSKTARFTSTRDFLRCKWRLHSSRCSPLSTKRSGSSQQPSSAAWTSTCRQVPQRAAPPSSEAQGFRAKRDAAPTSIRDDVGYAS